jgi:cobalt-precorrin 5A hydrolase
MRTLDLMAFTERGLALAQTIAGRLGAQGWRCRIASLKRESPLHPGCSLQDWTEDAFETARAVVFVGACGIAVRAVAPQIKSKERDPAVVVVDEGGRFAIPLLSGHLGGANRLAEEIARITGGRAVITTATDINGVFSVDEWAARQNMAICGLREAKLVSAALLEGRPVGLVSDFPVQGEPAGGIVLQGGGEIGICVTLDEGRAPFATTLRLIPRVVALGIGCRRGTGRETIERVVEAALSAHGIPPQSVAGVFSIDAKKDEPGLLAFCAAHSLPFHTFSAQELGRAAGEFSSSDFVERAVGVGNVCERAAVCAGRTLILPKQARDGVTVAAAQNEFTVRFE